MVSQAELISKGYHSLVPGIISVSLETVWVPLSILFETDPLIPHSLLNFPHLNMCWISCFIIRHFIQVLKLCLLAYVYIIVIVPVSCLIYVIVQIKINNRIFQKVK